MKHFYKSSSFHQKIPSISLGSGYKTQTWGSQTFIVLFVFKGPQKGAKTLGVFAFYKFRVVKVCNCCPNQDSKCKNEQPSNDFGSSKGLGALRGALGALGRLLGNLWVSLACLWGAWGLPRGVFGGSWGPLGGVSGKAGSRS